MKIMEMRGKTDKKCLKQNYFKKGVENEVLQNNK